MFGLRPDGKRLKDLDPLQLMTPNFMRTRCDSMNYYKNTIKCDPLDKYIEEQAKNGEHFTYMHIVIASIVRLFYIRPELNRFVMSGRIYQRNSIGLTFVAKADLKDDASDIQVKIDFTGKETLHEIKEMINKAILENKQQNATKNTVNVMKRIPNCLVKFGLCILRFLDRHGCAPKFFLKASPFHTSFFFNTMKSLKIDAIYHHVYNFGTTGLFVSMGKEKFMPCVLEDNETIVPAKMMNLNIVMDERFCDGFYYAKSLRIWNKLLYNPELMENPPEEDEEIAILGSKLKKIKKSTATK